MQKVTPLERLFLRIEKPAYPMDVCGIFVLDPPAAGVPLSFERVKAELDRRTSRLPVFTKRVVQPTYGLAAERWINDGSFDIARHVRHVALPGPGTMGQLRDLVLALGDTPLERSRPLWAAWFVEGLEDGRSALVLRMHHALIDGMGGMQMLGDLLDLTPDQPSAQALSVPVAVQGERIPSSPELLARSVPDLALAPLRGTLQSWHVLRATVLKVPRRDRNGEAGGTPRTMFNRPVHAPDKSLAFFSLPLADVKQVRRAFDVTVNDVFLAVITSALRRYLQENGDNIDRPLTAMCPMNVRDPSDTSGAGNAFTFLFGSLPVHEESPLARLRLIAASMRKVVEAQRSKRGGPNLTEAATDIPHPIVWQLLGDLIASPYGGALPPVMNLAASNIMGPPIPLYFAGAKISHFYGRTMAISGIGLFIHCISYNGSLEFGMTSLEELLPDPDRLADLVAEGLQELVALARSRSAG
jgi:diacylglycerol O-acyltransferase